MSFLKNKEIQYGGPKMTRLMTSCVFKSLSHLVERSEVMASDMLLWLCIEGKVC